MFAGKPLNKHKLSTCERKNANSFSLFILGTKKGYTVRKKRYNHRGFNQQPVVYLKRARGASLRCYRRSLSSGLGLSGSGSGDGLGLWPNSGDITMYLRGIPSRSSGVRIDSLGGVSFDFVLKNFLNSVNTTCTDAGYSS